MNTRTTNYLILLLLVIIFSTGLTYIKPLYQKEVETNKPHNRFISPLICLSSFFIGCCVVSVIVKDGEVEGTDQFSGIYYMFLIALILTIGNMTILTPYNMKKYMKGKKFTVTGLFMALGVSAIVFGFMDNFGMKLGIDALDNTFLSVFLSPFSNDTRFKDHKESIKNNLKIINDWTTGDWRKLVNQLLRFESTLKDVQTNDKYSSICTLTDAIKSFEGKPLEIPKEILENPVLTNDYVDNLRSRFDTIDGSKAMLGNTFSDFIGAILGAGVINLFVYMTNYDGIYTGDNTDDSWLVKNLNSYMPILEGVFIAIGCLVPVFIHIAMDRTNPNINNTYCWIIIAIISIILIIMMYISSKGVKTLNTTEKKKSLVKSINDMTDRLDIDPANNIEENRVYNKIKNLLESL